MLQRIAADPRRKFWAFVVLVLLVMFTVLAWNKLPDREIGQQIILAIAIAAIFIAIGALGYRNARRR